MKNAPGNLAVVVLLALMFMVSLRGGAAAAYQMPAAESSVPAIVDPAASMRVLEIVIARFADGDFETATQSGLNEFLRLAGAKTINVQGPFEHQDPAISPGVSQPQRIPRVTDPRPSGANVLVATVDPSRLEELRARIHGGKHSELLSSPKLMLIDGYPADIFTGAERPFVTNLMPVASGGVLVWQPRISLIPDGFALTAVCRPVEDHVRVDLQLTSRKIHAAEEVVFDPANDASGRFQFPDLTVSSARAGALMRPGETVLLVPSRSFDGLHAAYHASLPADQRGADEDRGPRQPTATRLAVFVTLKDASARTADNRQAEPAAKLR